VAVCEGVIDGVLATSVCVGKLNVGGVGVSRDGLGEGLASNGFAWQADRDRKRITRIIMNVERRGTMRALNSTNARQHFTGEHFEHPGGPEWRFEPDLPPG